MGLVKNWLSRKEKVVSALPKPSEVEPVFRNEDIPNTLNLGWYYSAERNEYQMLKVAKKDILLHLFVIGSTGSGKTKLFEFLNQQHIEEGDGFGAISINADWIRNIKGFIACYANYFGDNSIYDRVVEVNPSDPRYTVVFNVLERSQGVSASRQSNELITAFKRVWEDSWGPRMEDLLRNSLIALCEAGLTLGDLPQFLTFQKFREQVLNKVENPIARAYFERFDSLSNRDRLTWMEPVTNKVNAFLSDDRIRIMLSHPKSSFNLREIMDNNMILLINNDKGQLGEEPSNLLNALFLAKLQIAAFSRSNIPEHQRIPWILYLDEVPNYVDSGSLDTLLSEGRKNKISCAMDNQALAQLPPELQSIILANTGVQVYFRINRKDAEILAKEGFEYSGYDVKTVSVSGGTRYWSLGEEWERHIEELQNLPPRFAYVKHKIEGGMLPIQTVEIVPPHEVLGMDEAEYYEYLDSLPIGRKFLVERERLIREGTSRGDEESHVPGDGFTNEERAFLEFIFKNPDTPVSQVYKALGLSVRKGNQIRDGLKARGLIEEIETRLGKAGRMAKFFVPTFQAFERLGKDLPNGRGGAIHRHIQQMVSEGANAKGYKAQVEKNLGNGGNVDVHLEKGAQRIAVEVAVVSKPERELEHIRHCLDAGYDRVFTIFADEKLMVRTQEAMAGIFSDKEIARVRLLPLRKLEGFF